MVELGSNQLWKFSRAGKFGGPVTAGALLAMIDGGQLGPDDQVWSARLGSWQPVADATEMVRAAAADPPPAVALPVPTFASPPFASPPFDPPPFASPPFDPPLAPPPFAPPPLAPTAVAPPAMISFGSATSSASRLAASTRKTWKYSRAGVLGPAVSASELSRMADAGELAGDDLVWGESLGAWQSLAASKKAIAKAVAAEGAAAAGGATPVGLAMMAPPPLPGPSLPEPSFVAGPLAPQAWPPPPLSSPASLDLQLPPPLGAAPADAGYSNVPAHDPNILSAPAVNLSSRPPEPRWPAVGSGASDPEPGTVVIVRPPRKPIDAVIVRAAAAAVVVLVVLLAVVWFRKAEPPPRPPELAQLAEAKALADAGRDREAAAKYRSVVAAVGDRGAGEPALREARETALSEALRLERLAAPVPPRPAVVTAADGPAARPPPPPPARPPSTVPVASRPSVPSLSSPTPVAVRPAIAPPATRPDGRRPDVPTPPIVARAPVDLDETAWTFVMPPIPEMKLRNPALNAVVAAAAPPAAADRGAGDADRRWQIAPAGPGAGVVRATLTGQDPQTLARKALLTLSVDPAEGLLTLDVAPAPADARGIELHLLDRAGAVVARVRVLRFEDDRRLASLLDAAVAYGEAEERVNKGTADLQAGVRQYDLASEKRDELERSQRSIRARGVPAAVASIAQKIDEQDRLLADLGQRVARSRQELNEAGRSKALLERKLGEAIDGCMVAPTRKRGT